jgi:hydroxymethylpyrimidine pyrophosphatase-like HAD family hydrolase
MFNGGVDTMRALYRALNLEADGFAVSLTEYTHRDFSLIDVTAPGATKGRALAWRAAQLGIARDEVMAVGDNFNDLEMLEFAGLPVVMANSVEELKQRGWPITGDNENAGLAEAIRRFVFDDC